jgi:hypothetical protein
MITLAYKQGTRCAVTNACSVAVCLFTFIAAPLVAANPVVDTGVIRGDHPTEHLHDHQGKAWPPQPDGIKDIVVFSNPEKEKLLKSKDLNREVEKEKPVKLRSDVRRALGKRFTKATIAENESKDGSEPTTTVTYFSHSKNATVVVDMVGEKKQKVTNVKVIPASKYQPEPTEEEYAEAKKIAYAYFASVGQKRASELQAYGILAHPKNKSFYSTRVIYISFHINSDSPPEFVALVDLTNQKVIDAREEK